MKPAPKNSADWVSETQKEVNLLGRRVPKNWRADILAAAFAGRNRNRVRNGSFIVNQRAAASGASLASGAFFVDGWQSTAAANAVTWTATGQERVLTVPATKTIAQVIEQADIQPGDYVLSWEGTATARVYNAGATVPALAAGPVYVTLDGLANVKVEFGAGTVSRVQLELLMLEDQSPSSFEWLPYGDQLLRCQRYYYRLNGTADNEALGSGMVISATSVLVIVPFPVTMRAVPTQGFSAFGTFGFRIGASNYTATAISVSASIVTGLSFGTYGLGQTGLTAGQAAVIRTSPGSTAWLDFNAEIAA